MVDEPMMSKSALKVLLNVVLIAGDALVRGGSLDIGAEKHDSGLDIVVRAEGAGSCSIPGLQVLVGETPEDEVAPAAAAWLVHCLVEEGGGQIQVADGEEGMLLIGASPAGLSGPIPAGGPARGRGRRLEGTLGPRSASAPPSPSSPLSAGGRVTPNPASSGTAPAPARRPHRRRWPARAGSASCRRGPGP